MLDSSRFGSTNIVGYTPASNIATSTSNNVDTSNNSKSQADDVRDVIKGNKNKLFSNRGVVGVGIGMGNEAEVGIGQQPDFNLTIIAKNGARIPTINNNKNVPINIIRITNDICSIPT